MPKVELEATAEEREATLDLAGAEAIADLGARPVGVSDKLQSHPLDN